MKALITGVTGQDGSYLAEMLLNKGYEVYGVVRRSSSFNRERIDHIRTSKEYNGQNFHLVYGDLNDASSLNRIMEKVGPDEIYNLAAQSHVGISFEIPEYTAEITALGVVRILDAMREVGLNSKFYQASSSELYGKVVETPQNEETPFYPRSPYACAKAYGYWIVKNYRESYDMFACNGILFNHESPRRGENFVSRKITLSMARMKHGLQDTLKLGNMDAKRDWGYAKDYVEAMWLMLQQEQPDDYVVATGQTNTVRSFVEMTAKRLDWEIEWQGQGVDEKGIDKKSGKVLVEISPKYFRPAEVDLLLGDPSKAKEKLGWEPKVDLEGLVDIMVKSDLEQAKKEALIRG